MAGREFNAISGSVALGAGVTKTVLMLSAGSTVGVESPRSSISFDGTSPTAGKVLVEWVKGATGGTGSSVTPQKIKGSGSVLATARDNFSAEPSGGTVIRSELVHPQSGYTMPEQIDLDPSDTISIRCTAPASVNARASFAKNRE